MFVRLSPSFGRSPEGWLAMQAAYDLWAVRKRAKALKIKRLKAAWGAPPNAPHAAQACESRVSGNPSGSR